MPDDVDSNAQRQWRRQGQRRPHAARAVEGHVAATLGTGDTERSLCDHDSGSGSIAQGEAVNKTQGGQLRRATRLSCCRLVLATVRRSFHAGHRILEHGTRVGNAEVLPSKNENVSHVAAQLIAGGICKPTPFECLLDFDTCHPHLHKKDRLTQRMKDCHAWVNG